MSETFSPPVCPHCGFRVFNRRFPKCESCGQALPESLVMSTAERERIWQKEAAEAPKKPRWNQKRRGRGEAGDGDFGDFGGWGGDGGGDGGGGGE